MGRFLFLVLFSFISSALTAQTATVYFEFNNFILSNDARNTLNKFIASGKITFVGFFGHTDQVGGAEYNEWLSVQRALAVKDYLISKGLKETQVSVVRGFGAERPITKDPDPTFQQLNRRVSLTNDYTPSPGDITAATKQSAIHYTASPTLIKQNEVSTTATASANVPVLNGETKIGTGENTASKEESTAKETQIKKEVEASKEVPAREVVKENSTSKETALDNITKTEKKNETSNTNQTIEPPIKQEPKEVAKGSFADRLSKAVNKPEATKPSPVTEKPSGNTKAPVVKLQKHEKLVEDIRDKSTKEGEHIVLRHINFYGGRHAFLPQAYPALDDLLETMQKIPTLEIEIQGHICCREDDGDEIDFDSGEPVLSITRAKAVYDFLVDNNIDKKRMSYKGLAHKFPIIKEEANEAEATVNRRVEIKIIKK